MKNEKKIDGEEKTDYNEDNVETRNGCDGKKYMVLKAQRGDGWCKSP